MTRIGTQLSFWFFRAPLAVFGGVIIGQVIQVPLAFLLDLIWQNDVTGGRWPFTFPNVLLTCLVGLIAGFTTGWIAGRRGKLFGAVAIFMPLWLLLTVAIIKNVDPTEYFEQMYDTKPALWIWIALAPGIIGGHFGALNGKRYFNQAALFCAAGFAWVAGIGFSLFHLYTAFVAFEAGGFFAAIITLSFPVVSELYWGWRIWNESGYFLNHYISFVVMLVAFFAIAGLSGIAHAKTKKWVENTNES